MSESMGNPVVLKAEREAHSAQLQQLAECAMLRMSDLEAQLLVQVEANECRARELRVNGTPRDPLTCTDKAGSAAAKSGGPATCGG